MQPLVDGVFREPVVRSIIDVPGCAKEKAAPLNFTAEEKKQQRDEFEKKCKLGKKRLASEFLQDNFPELYDKRYLPPV